MILEENIKNVVIVGDLHLGIHNNSVMWSDIQNEYLTKTFPRQLTESGYTAKDSILILEGDIFHSRQSIDVRIFNNALTLFGQLSNMFRSVYIILGNHDVYYKQDNSINSVQVLGRLFKNIWVFENPQKLCINNKHKFLLLPWVEQNTEITEIVEKNANRCDYIVCHADIQGANMNSVTKLETGIDPHALATYKRIYAGHIHLRQEIKKYGASVLYNGTPYSMDRNDIGNQKGFDILSFDGDDIIERFIPNEESPKYVRKNMYTVLEMNEKEIHEFVRNNFVDIQLDNRIANRFSVQVFMDLIKEMGYKEIVFTPYTPKDTMDTKQILQNAETNGVDLSIPNMFVMYMDHKGYDRGMRKKIETKFNSLLAKVKEQQTKD